MKTYLYCPKCGTKGSVSWESPSTGRCSHCDVALWNNPSATVAVIFRKGNQVLFAKRGIEPNKGKYDFPGGFIEHNEDPYEACVREIEEETTVSIQPQDLRLITAYTSEYVPERSVTDLVFVITKWKGNFMPQDDVAALEWKPLSFTSSREFSPQAYKDLAEKLADLG